MIPARGDSNAYGDTYGKRGLTRSALNPKLGDEHRHPPDCCRRRRAGSCTSPSSGFVQPRTWPEKKTHRKKRGEKWKFPLVLLNSVLLGFTEFFFLFYWELELELGTGFCRLALDCVEKSTTWTTQACSSGRIWTSLLRLRMPKMDIQISSNLGRLFQQNFSILQHHRDRIKETIQSKTHTN